MQLLIAFLLSPLLFFGQNSIKRKILDKETNNPVPFATIKILHQPKGIIASEKGEFILDIQQGDSVFVSSVGYQQKIFMAEIIDSIIYLNRKIKSMTEVTIGTKKLIRTFVLGNGADYLKKTIHCQYEAVGRLDCWPWGPGNKKDEFAERIDLPDPIHYYKIKELIIPVQVKCTYPMLVHIYSADPNSECPGEELLAKSVRFEKFLQHRKAVIDLSDENILLHGSSSFFISLAWIWEDDSTIPCFTNIIMLPSSKGNTYSRTLANSDYRWFNFGKVRTKENEEYTITTFYAVRLDEMK